MTAICEAMRMRLFVGGLCLLGACTEPNPFAQMDSEDGTSSGGTTMSMTTAGPGPSSTSVDTTTTASTSASTDDTSAGPTTTEGPMPDTPVACPSGSMCVAEAPADWNGPVIIAVTDVGAEPSCAGDYPEPALAAFDELDAPPADCECSCGAVTGASCTNPTLEYHAGDAACASPNDDWTVTTGCVSVSAPGADYWLVEPPEISGGDCTPNVVSDDVPPWSWGTAVTTCTGMLGSIGCDAGSLCAPLPEPPFDASICIWRDDAVTCPDGPYSARRRIYYTEVSDTRGCGECQCEDAEGTCAGTVRLFSDTTCSQPAYTVTADGDCELQANAIGVARARWMPGTITASCDPAGGEPMGLAAGAGRYTVCCLGV
jgi:hypothetical protein